MAGTMLHAYAADICCKILGNTEEDTIEFIAGSLLPDASGTAGRKDSEGKVINDKYPPDFPKNQQKEGEYPKSKMTSHIGGAMDRWGI